MTAGACHFDFNLSMAAVIGIGHHFIPQQVWQGIDKASKAWQVLDKVTSGKLKNPKLSNPFDRLHRAVNRQTEEVVRKLERDLGKSVEDFEKGDWEELGARLERAGGDIETFNARLAALEPEARTLGQAMAETLVELYPAASNAAGATADAVGTAAEAAAESGIIEP